MELVLKQTIRRKAARLSITDLRQKTLSIQVRGEISQTLPLIKSAKPWLEALKNSQRNLLRKALEKDT